MKVLVTGGTGYIGRVLVPDLVSDGYTVTVMDRCFLNYDNVEKEYDELGVKLLKDDIRFFDPNIMRGFDAVVDLAALSNDPSGDLDPLKTWDINYIGRVRVARLAKKVGATRYIVTSSCSVYGFREDTANEKSGVNPLTEYARANVQIEKDNLFLNDGKFSVTALRLATAFGYSKRMRLDLAINAMAYNASTTGKVKLMRDGSQYRPFVHVKDISRSIRTTLGSDSDRVSGETFNIGSNSLNVKLRDLAESIRNLASVQAEIEWYGDPDVRSYKVDFSKAKNVLGFEAETSIEDGVKEIIGEVREERLADLPQMHTVNYYKYLMDSRSVIERIGKNYLYNLL